MQAIEDLDLGNRCGDCGLCTDRPNIPMYAPYSVKDLTEGQTYLWCSCGHSKTEPFCDNVGCALSSFRPFVFSAKPQKLHLLCGCKYSQSPPFCDGSHSFMEFEPSRPPCKCDLKIRMGKHTDEDFYIEGTQTQQQQRKRSTFFFFVFSRCEGNVFSEQRAVSH